jgi:transposase
MKYIEGIDRHQLILYPETLDDLMAYENPIRVIDVFVDNLDLAGIGFKKTNLDKTVAGRPCYSPKVLLKLYIYGYFKKVRSSRKLMELSLINIEVMWLMGRQTPDFRTISDFRKDNAEAIKQVFKLFTQICADLDLYSKEISVQDGSKFRAVNSKDKNLTESKLEKKLELIDEKISKYLQEMDKTDAEESDSPKYTKEEIEEKIKTLRERAGQFNELREKMKEEDESQISFTDPDSRLMKTANGGFDVCYNIQVIVDTKSHMVGAFDVTNRCNDLGLLSPVTSELKKTLCIEMMEVVADKGFEDMSDMLECLMNGTIPHVPSKSGSETYELCFDYKEAIITEELLNSTKAEDIKTCLECGILPNVYKDKGIEISVKEVKEYGSNGPAGEVIFTLNEEGTAVICPNGSELTRVARLHGKSKTRFTSRSACKKCDDKCTTSSFRQVDMKDDQMVLSGRKIRSVKKVKKVKITLRPDKDKILKRKCVVEHPFGTIKRWQDGSYTLLRGIEKVSADLALMFLSYNIKRAISLMGTQALKDGIKEIMRNRLGGCSAFFSFFPNYRYRNKFTSLFAANF